MRWSIKLGTALTGRSTAPVAANGAAACADSAITAPPMIECRIRKHIKPVPEVSPRSLSRKKPTRTEAARIVRRNDVPSDHFYSRSNTPSVPSSTTSLTAVGLYVRALHPALRCGRGNRNGLTFR
ncbi:hypothetical protein EVAR_6150_1 [Eumeta japonica]|uniref:Uncharacterized protein n=1 Tax=Eumeta variegata TaxID=151549 RepID=A0A4C1TFF9_EUMVA|nr:hypothetical protein EVAR_6150_1 [Eumeta japonica]